MIKLVELLVRLGKMLAAALPFLLVALLNMKLNLKKKDRARQFYMPVLALVFCIAVLIFLPKLTDLLLSLVRLIPDLLERLANWVRRLEQGKLENVAQLVDQLRTWVQGLLRKLNLTFWIFFIANFVFFLAYVLFKRIILTILKPIFRDKSKAVEKIAGLFYERDEKLGKWYVKQHMGHARTYLRTFYLSAVGISIAAFIASAEMYQRGWLEVPFYPVFGIIVLGELYFFLCGLTRDEMHAQLSAEEDEADEVVNYSLLRQALRKLFGDKLSAENTTVAHPQTQMRTNDELLCALEEDGVAAVEAYGRFMRRQVADGLELDQNYLASGEALLAGKSILFNNPFCYDLIPYIFYPMNRQLLQHRKVLVILGRHGAEDDAAAWLREGLTSVTHVPSMWRIGVLDGTEQALDVGIVTRSTVHDLPLHAANEAFFQEVGFVVLLEPSRLLTTAQIGLNSLVRCCRMSGRQLTFCSMDKNCDGLVDALSHVLMTSLSEVSATNRHRGSSSYMLWEADGEHLQHRMLPNISRYLGVGTELSFAALKNQVEKTDWYGGDAFPVVDIHWIVRQYYHDLLAYANLPQTQDTIDNCFAVSPQLWSARVEKDHYMTVEDEACNMFEVKRAFETRAREQGFINVIAPDYLLRDYMAANDGLFNADPKAIPYIVADYAHTNRNVALRLCLRMSTGMVTEEDVRRELLLIDADLTDLRRSLWHEICACTQAIGAGVVDKDRGELLICQTDRGEQVFTSEILCKRRKFSVLSGQMETLYYIQNERFIRVLLSDLQSAGYIAEDERGERQYLGMELRGQVFQKYLPGQFFTFCGKYYEMLRVTADGQVLVRRAADHITGRPAYRQVRGYFLSHVIDSDTMGDQVEIGGMRITRQFADLRVETPGYWKLDRYSDFAHGKYAAINGVPERRYFNKQVLRIDLPADAGVTPEITRTIALLFNEVFRTLFAENQGFIAAVAPEQAQAPATYSLTGEDGFEPGEGCIYILEDSQLDLGLLDAVQRNLGRIFSILCDYLDWNESAIEESQNPPPPPAVPEVPRVDVPPEKAQKKKNIFRRVIEKIKGLFKRKKKEKDPNAPEKPKKEKKKKRRRGKPEEPVQEPVPTPEGEPAVPAAPPAEPEIPAAPETPDTGEEQPEAPVAPEAAPADVPEEAPEMPEAESEATSEPPVEAEDALPEDEDAPDQPMFSTGPRRLAEEDPSDPTAIEPMEPVEPVDAPAEPISDGKDELEFEPEKAMKPVKDLMVRLPYHERYYLLYGHAEVPAGLDIAGTQALLHDMGFDNGELKQAREGKSVAEMIEQNFVPNQPGKHYCDFCGTELIGTEYERLADGRERCIQCGRNSVKTAAEFVALHHEVVRNLETLYGVRINVPIHIQMVNAKKLHRRLGKSFVPTGKFNGRVLGVAIKDRNGYSILIENGAPRIQSIMTMVHEMTHIWQYCNWNAKGILKRYGKGQNLEVYEGMAKWVEIQYAYLINEPATAKREEIITRHREDEYGRGFRLYVARYPLSEGTVLKGETPFQHKSEPL